MGQVTFIVLLAIAGWLGWRMLKREQARIAAQRREVEQRKGDEPTRLERDPDTGVYRPVDRSDTD